MRKKRERESADEHKGIAPMRSHSRRAKPYSLTLIHAVALPSIAQYGGVSICNEGASERGVSAERRRMTDRRPTWLLQDPTDTHDESALVHEGGIGSLTVRIVLHQPRRPCLPLDHLLLHRRLHARPFRLERRRITILPRLLILANLVAHRGTRDDLDPRASPSLSLPAIQSPRRQCLPHIAAQEIALRIGVSGLV